jgi:hypothetical protein
LRKDVSRDVSRAPNAYRTTKSMKPRGRFGATASTSKSARAANGRRSPGPTRRCSR